MLRYNHLRNSHGRLRIFLTWLILRRYTRSLSSLAAIYGTLSEWMNEFPFPIGLLHFLCFDLIWLCSRRIVLYPTGNKRKNAVNDISIYLQALEMANESEGWSRDVKVKLVVFNQLNTNMTIIRGVIFFPLCKLIDKQLLLVY
jgi:hypothetical protein